MFDYADQELALKLTIEEEKRLSLDQGIKIGKRDGMKIGKRDEKQKIAKRMLAQKKVSLEDIASYTALPLSEIQRIAALYGNDPRDNI